MTQNPSQTEKNSIQEENKPQSRAEQMHDMMDEIREKLKENPDPFGRVLLRALEKTDEADPTWGEGENTPE